MHPGLDVKVLPTLSLIRVEKLRLPDRSDRSSRWFKMTPVDMALYQHADKAKRPSLQNTSNCSFLLGLVSIMKRMTAVTY